MKIGIISDSHRNNSSLRLAIDILKNRQADAIAHCGDFGTTVFPPLLSNLDIPVYAVGGNVDIANIASLLASASQAGANMQRQVNTIPIGNGKSLAMTHEHDRSTLRELIENEDYPYVCHGHTHRLRDEIIGSTRVICPGGLERYATPYPTLVILDTSTDNLDIIKVVEDEL